MDLVKERIATARRAWRSLAELVDADHPGGAEHRSTIERDATILRFEYTFEAVWKAAMALLPEEGFQFKSPKAVIRASRQVGWLTDEQAAAAMTALADRNNAVHAYNEALAEQIASRIAGHAKVMDAWLSALETAAADEQ